MRLRTFRVPTALAAALVVCGPRAPERVLAWDSEHGNPTHSTHSYITQWAIQELSGTYPELAQYREALIKGANCELHELPARNFEKDLGRKYGVDAEALRVTHRGTNEGCDDIQGWWNDSLAAYRKGNKERAYFLTGVMLHMIEDMGVPAHANKVVHQSGLRDFDNFEFLALNNWKPGFDHIDRTDPGHDEPWRYYAVSREWTHADAPGYHDRDAFAKFWATASAAERELVKNRQGRTCHVARWAMASASKAFTGH